MQSKTNFYKKEEAFHYKVIIPVVLFLAGTMGYCIFYLINLSFQDAIFFKLDQAKYVGLETFRKVLAEKEAWTAIKNSIIWMTVSTTLIVTLGIATGYLLSRNTSYIKFTRAFMLLPWVLPGAVVAGVWKWLFNSQSGIINQMMINIGIIDKGISWLGNADYALGAVILVIVWRLFPLFGIVMAAAIQSIDHALFEAARVDGASKWHQFWYITLPSISGYIWTMAIINLIWVVNNLVLVQVMTGGGPVYASQILPVYMYKLAFVNNLLSESAVISLINAVILTLISLLYIRNLKSQQMEGAR